MISQYKVDTIRLKKKMVEQRLEKLTDLSEASTIDRNTLSKVVNGDHKPSSAVIEKLMIALHIESMEAGEIFFSHNLRKT